MEAVVQLQTLATNKPTSWTSKQEWIWRRLWAQWVSIIKSSQPFPLWFVQWREILIQFSVESSSFWTFGNKQTENPKRRTDPQNAEMLEVVGVEVQNLITLLSLLANLLGNIWRVNISSSQNCRSSRVGFGLVLFESFGQEEWFMRARRSWS